MTSKPLAVVVGFIGKFPVAGMALYNLHYLAGLIEGFLNPVMYDAGHAITDDVAAGAIIRGMTRQVGN